MNSSTTKSRTEHKRSSFLSLPPISPAPEASLDYSVFDRNSIVKGYENRFKYNELIVKANKRLTQVPSKVITPTPGWDSKTPYKTEVANHVRHNSVLDTMRSEFKSEQKSAVKEPDVEAVVRAQSTNSTHETKTQLLPNSLMPHGYLKKFISETCPLMVKFVKDNCEPD